MVGFDCRPVATGLLCRKSLATLLHIMVIHSGWNRTLIEQIQLETEPRELESEPSHLRDSGTCLRVFLRPKDFRKWENVQWWNLERAVVLKWWGSSLKILLIRKGLCAADGSDWGKEIHSFWMQDRMCIFPWFYLFFFFFYAHLMVVFKNAKWLWLP